MHNIHCLGVIFLEEKAGYIGCIKEISRRNKATYEIKEYILQYLNSYVKCLLQNIWLCSPVIWKEH